MQPEDNLQDWDEEKYRLLNAHFRQQINELLRTDLFLSEAAAAGKSIQLHDLIGRMKANDQLLWLEFMKLDRIKLHLDMNDHLEGRGTPYSPQSGFSNNATGPQNDLDEPW